LNRSIKVTKASGTVEDLNTDKLRSSLLRSGADRSTVEEVIDRVVREIEPYTSTKKIYRLSKKFLKQFNHASGLRYSLKKALLKLGPSGYPFEQYYGKVLSNYGYKTETGIVLVRYSLLNVNTITNRELQRILRLRCTSMPGFVISVMPSSIRSRGKGTGAVWLQTPGLPRTPFSMPGVWDFI
jgi:hypothetical protein